MKKITTVVALAAFSSLFFFGGCQKQNAEKKSQPAVQQGEHDGHDHSGHDHGHDEHDHSSHEGHNH